MTPCALPWLPGIPDAQAPQTAQLLVLYRGLRVRMGLHSGLTSDAAMAFNKVNMTYQYTGAPAHRKGLESARASRH